GSTTARQWITTHNGQPDIVAPYPAQGRATDKQWITIDTNPGSPFFGRIYAMWAVFTGPATARPFVAIAQALPDGTHTDWSAPISLPEVGGTPQGSTYLLPHVTPDGTLYTSLVTTMPKKGYCCDVLFLDKSADGGMTWTSTLISDTITATPFVYPNPTFRDGIEESFAVGNQRIGGHYPLYVTWEDYSAGVVNILLAASYDDGATWSSPIQVNDNASAVDEFQPNLDVAANGTVSVAFYDRRLLRPAPGPAAASARGFVVPPTRPFWHAGRGPAWAAPAASPLAPGCANSSATLPPYGA